MTSPRIDPARLQPLLAEARGRVDVDAVAECTSTSSVLLERAAVGAPAGSVLVADRQTAGRGRRGRHWQSSPEASLTFSLLWRFPGGVERLAGLSLAAGVAVARALHGCGATGIALKWPNDILLVRPRNDPPAGKLGGILVELQAERDAMLAVIGIGLNLQRPHPDDVPPMAGTLSPAGLDEALPGLPERHRLLAGLLTELVAALDRFAVGGFAALREEWLHWHAWQDRPVRLLQDGKALLEGCCRGADADGALLIETATGIERCLSGDLSLRAV